MKNIFDVFIEIEQGSKNNKYERDSKTGKLVLDFVFQNITWPFNYGEIIGSQGGDGDPLDALVFSSAPLKQGTTVECLLFGVMLTLDRGVVDDKILMAPVGDKLAGQYKDIGDFSKNQKTQMEDFYSEVARQKKKIIQIKGFKNKKFALGLIEKSLI